MEPEEIEKIIIENENLKEEVKELQKLIKEGRDYLQYIIDSFKNLRKDLNDLKL
jgi:cell division septum initiation protein DivIVA